MNTRTILAVTFLGLMLGACTTNPTTGRRQFNALTRDDEIAMGLEASPQMVQEYGGKVPSDKAQAYVVEVGKKLAAQTEADYPGLPWEYTLLNSEVINAFALPGGKVFLTRGLAEKMTNEAQLAAVLGHETGHVTARHINDRVTQQLEVGVIAAVAGAVVGQASKNDTVKEVAPVTFALGSQLVLLKFSRSQELEADSLGMRYMSKIGYDPKGARQVMEILDKESQSRGVDLFATHPDPKARIDRINTALQGEYAYTQGNTQFKLHDTEYRQRLLSQLPPIKTTDAGGRVFNLGDPSAWCAVCRANGQIANGQRANQKAAD